MKETVQGWIQRYLTLCARLYLWRAKPKVIGITGSVGKTTTKEAIAFLLRSTVNSQLSSVRSAVGSMNGVEYGFQLSVLGFAEVPATISWIPALITAGWRVLFLESVDWLILEYGIDKPGDMNYLLKIVRPDIAVVTMIAEAHTEALGSLEGVYLEKTKLLDGLKPRGLAIIPAGDRRLMAEVVPERLTYGALGPKADAEFLKVDSSLTGTALQARVLGRQLRFQSQLLGAEQNYALLVAMLVGSKFGMRPEVAAQILRNFSPVAGRLRVIPGKKGTTILDDSYNANLASMEAALKVLDEATHPKGVRKTHPSGGRARRRRVAVLGEMRELGKLSGATHRKLGELIPRYCDLAIIVGPFEELTVQAALRKGFGVGQIQGFATTGQAIEALVTVVEPKDVILVKASQNEMRFERIVEALMARPQDAKKLLVRQSRYWRRKV